MSTRMLPYWPHAECLLSDPFMMAFHILGDATIAAAYFAIPTALWYFTRHRKDMPFRMVVVWFGIFIIGCGLTHVGNIVEMFYPAYALTACVKLLTALASWMTLAKLLPIIPQALTLPSLADVERIRAWVNQPLPSVSQDVVRDMEKLVHLLERLTRSQKPS